MANSLDVGTTLMWYRIDAILGRGGFGITYLATDINLGKQVAIKEYLPGEISTRHLDSRVFPRTEANQELYRWGLLRFLEEARILARFKHENIVTVLAVFEENNTAYMVMEYEQGRDLESVVHLPGYQSEKVLLDIFSRLANGLTVVHEQNIIHRDIKPANIFIRADGTPVLLDFGSARQSVSGQSRALTRILTKGYAPYEQIEEGGQQGPWTDVYSIGATLYYIISGGLPADAISRLTGIARAKADPLTPVSELVLAGKYSFAFTQAIDMALEFEIEDRPQDVTSFIELLSGTTEPGVVSDDPPLKDDLTVLSETVFYSGHEREASQRSISRKSTTSRASGERISRLEPTRRRVIRKFLSFGLLFGGGVALLYLSMDVFKFDNDEVIAQLEVPRVVEYQSLESSVVELDNYSVEEPIERPKTKPVEKLETKPVEKLETKPVEKLETKPVEKHETKPVEKLETKPVEKLETKPVKKLETKPVKKLESKPVKKLETKPLGKPKTKPAEKPDTDLVIDSVIKRPIIDHPKKGLPVMTERLQAMITALEQLDNERLSQISRPSLATKKLLDGIASRYVSAKVSVSGLQVLESKGVANAIIGLDEVFRESGERVTPGNGWNRFTVTLKRKNDVWGLLEW